MKRLALLALVLMLLAAAAAVVLFGGRRGAGAIEPRAALAAGLAEPSPSAPLAVAAEPAPGVRAEVPVVAVAPAAPAADEHAGDSVAAPAERLRVRGRLVRSSDRLPVAGEELGFQCGEEYTQVTTDEAGRFETEPIFAPGAVRAWHVADPERSKYEARLHVEPERVLLERPLPGGEPAEVELCLVEPAAWVEIEVVDPSGAAAQADIRWVAQEAKSDSNPWPWRSTSTKRTDAAGRARLPFSEIAPGASLALLARSEGGRVSDPLLLEAPPDERVRLVVDLGGSLRALVRYDQGGPAEGARCGLFSADRRFALLFNYAYDAPTGSDGTALLEPLPSGRYSVRCEVGRGSKWILEEAAVERGRTTEVLLVVEALSLAASGRVVDESDRPLAGVRLELRSADQTLGATSDERGEFAFRARSAAMVEVSTAADLISDRFQPAAVEVPSGTTGILFRRTMSLPATPVTIEVVERGSLARIPAVIGLAFAESNEQDCLFLHASDGLIALECKLYSDARIAIESVGYRRRIVPLPELVEDGPEGGPHRVELERGLERALLVLDGEDERPLSGASVLDGDVLVATTDSDGRAEIDLPEWPAELVIRAPGYADGTWTCRDWISELSDGWVWLDRAAEVGGDG